jgi:tetratricopeptide (TPR) repeat protein
MLKHIILLLLIVVLNVSVKAQSADSVYNRYLDFNLARLQGNSTGALSIGESLLANANKLPAKSQISFYNGIAKVYEDYHQNEKAIRYYEIVAAAVPDYYVAHRALGYLYVLQADELYKKLKAETGDKTALNTSYQNAVRKALPHLEKAQACDPSDETLKLIQMLYTNISDNAALQTLSKRLEVLNKNCMDILSD